MGNQGGVTLFLFASLTLLEACFQDRGIGTASRKTMNAHSSGVARPLILLGMRGGFTLYEWIL